VFQRIRVFYENALYKFTFDIDIDMDPTCHNSLSDDPLHLISDKMSQYPSLTI